MGARAVLAVLAIALTGWLAVHLTSTPVAGLGQQVDAHLHASGVASPITAVLLNFRALDTLYEVSVLAVALIATLSLEPTRQPRVPPSPGPLLVWLVPRLTPVMLLLAGYLWWAGSTRPGGAFQAGVTIAGLLLLLALKGPDPGLQGRGGHALAMAGPLWFLLVGSATALAGSAFLQYPDAWVKTLILTVEGVLTAAIGVTLALLAGGGRRQA